MRSFPQASLAHQNYFCWGTRKTKRSAMKGYLAFIALLLAQPEESHQGSSSNPGPSCSQYTTNTPLLLANQCGRWNVRRSSSSSSWFARFLEIFRLPAEDIQEDPLIIGGSPATIVEAPWLTFVSATISGKSYSCTGSIIDQLHVLTAAHCFFDGSISATGASVLVGNANYQLGTRFYAKDVYIHPSYNKADHSQGHDIAVIKLNKTLSFSPSVQPICVPQSDSLSDAGACPTRVFGWGRTTETPAVRPLNLQKLDVTVLSKEECSSYNKGFICVQGVKSGTGTCFGDSGGPTVVYANNLAYVMGVDSHHIGSCAQYPTRYTWVTANINFITDAVNS
ncbi:unnamed protein product [Darwinula stevensoni]|uniref:Peptidase S1 domain-containing protein n=1 Tax=Darwinula stevensoni TaxID=69355 RepID=A0A7R9A3C8_9CRUS|nr:unnamed protein product [Darwinula stevensoni]CAG0890447.1 unnamed protein product [Darwinula stevensoni]